MIDKEAISEINQHISDALEEWSTIMLQADADQWAVWLDYSDRDLMNALYIFNHVAQNIAIKSDYYDSDKDILDKMDAFKKGIRKGFGIDTIELARRVHLNSKKKTDDE